MTTRGAKCLFASKTACLAALLVVSACHSPSSVSQLSEQSTDKADSSTGSLALSGNGEGYQGDLPAGVYFERSPGYSCGAGLGTIGFSGSIDPGNRRITPDPCQPEVTEPINASVKYSRTAMSHGPSLYAGFQGRIFERGFPRFDPQPYSNEAWCTIEYSSGDFIDTVIRYDPETGSRTAVLFVTADSDPTQPPPPPLSPPSPSLGPIPVNSPSVWVGAVSAFAVVERDMDSMQIYRAPGFTLRVSSTPSNVDSTDFQGTLQVTLNGVVISGPASCLSAGN